MNWNREMRRRHWRAFDCFLAQRILMIGFVIVVKFDFESGPEIMGSIVTVPFTLHRCVMTLYKADASGNPILEQPVWMGAQ
jgi:hypothetical protein